MLGEKPQEGTAAITQELTFAQATGTGVVSAPWISGRHPVREQGRSREAMVSAAGMLILAGTETKADLGRVVNALQIARELDEAGDEVTVIFDGAGTQWIPALSDEEHKYHRLYEKIEGVIAGACSYCAGAYGVRDAIEGTDVELLDEFDGHPSVRKLISKGYQVLTF